MYRLDHVRKVFTDGTVAVDEVTLDIQAGERVAVIGPSGAGKTTLFRLLNATLRPTSGRLWFDEADLESLSGRRLRHLRRRIGTVYQQHNLVPQLRVINNVLAGRLGRWSLPKALLSLMSPQERSIALGALEQVGIPEKLYTRTAHLSGGQQQRVAIARALVQDPDVILADEPVSSVDPTLGRTIIELLMQLTETHKKTLVANLHAVSFALDFFPRVIGFRQGRVAFDLPSAAVTDKVMADLYAGMETSPVVSEYA
ncbi:MAG: phosphonate ABC transporter ATP-binding protein [Candidatus Entotheonellia bacterium]